MENTMQAPTTSAPVASAMPTASVPSSASQPVSSAPSSYQGSGSAATNDNGAAPGLPGAGGPAGFGSGSQPMAGGVSGTQRKPEYAASIPGPGSVLGLSDSNTSGQYPGKLEFNAGSNTLGSPGAADLRSPSFNPGLFGGGAAAANAAGAGPAQAVAQQQAMMQAQAKPKRKRK